MRNVSSSNHQINSRSTQVQLFRTGFVAMLPLWAGAIPFGIAFSVAASAEGFSGLEIQIMSLTAFAAAAQISAVALLSAGASTLEILITVIGLSIHLPLFGAAIAREVRLTVPTRAAVGFLLTDANVAISSALGPMRIPVLLGSGTSMYLGWNCGTALGVLLGQSVPDLGRFAIDFVVPLTFLAVVVPLVCTRSSLVVSAIAVTGTLTLSQWFPLGFAILASSLSGCLIGMRLTQKDSNGKQAGVRE